MTMLWIVLAIRILGLVAKLRPWADGRDAQSNLGYVSHQWLAAHRLSHVSDPER